ncbi:hypothetical protein HELRODRAFT_172080 [Helobdella robusta]|uniref:Uncharacterized protein n=1 Tax=Helobdella robusta TaxID=6412 RepID=T1F503_HELRO|nr:hypothetical protein HELRODRAFT_172080 [Helobdella robusta]ESO05064.1 hypothetical protein HELRODRAFT_172080 [Helobdella robusta]
MNISGRCKTVSNNKRSTLKELLYNFYGLVAKTSEYSSDQVVNYRDEGEDMEIKKHDDQTAATEKKCNNVAKPVARKGGSSRCKGSAACKPKKKSSCAKSKSKRSRSRNTACKKKKC